MDSLPSAATGPKQGSGSITKRLRSVSTRKMKPGGSPLGAGGRGCLCSAVCPRCRVLAVAVVCVSLSHRHPPAPTRPHRRRSQHHGTRYSASSCPSPSPSQAEQGQRAIKEPREAKGTRNVEPQPQPYLPLSHCLHSLCARLCPSHTPAHSLWSTTTCRRRLELPRAIPKHRYPRCLSPSQQHVRSRAQIPSPWWTRMVPPASTELTPWPDQFDPKTLLGGRKGGKTSSHPSSVP